MDANTNLFSQLAQCLDQVEQVRDELTDMLSKLSAEALACVYRPIMYAYYWMDEHGDVRFTNEDCDRFHLIRTAVYGTAKEVATLADWDRAYSRHRQK